MTRQQKLDKIAEEISSCRICRRGKTGLPVPGEGSASAKIVFIGEAPGKTEAQTGRPFVGRSGRLLREMIGRVGLSEKKVYITSPVKFLPKHGTPTDDEIRHGMIHLNNQLEVIKPKLIVLLGSVAARGMLGQKLAVLSRHGEEFKTVGRNYFLTIHPAAAIRFVKYRKLILADFRKLKKLLAP